MIFSLVVLQVMGRHYIGAWVVACCLLLVPLCPARSSSPQGVEGRSYSGTSLRVASGGFISPNSLWPRSLPEQRENGALTQFLVHGLVLFKRELRPVLGQPEESFAPSPQTGSGKVAERKKRALSLLATLHPVKPSAQDTGHQRKGPEAAEGQTSLRPIGKQPLRWGR